MKSFKSGAEVRFTHEGVRELLEKGMNSKFFGELYDTNYRITALTMHPGNKYVVRVTIEPPAPKGK